MDSQAVQQQVENIQSLQKLGFNVVTCGNCGTVLVVNKERPTICPSCNAVDTDIDNPDLWY